MTRDMFDVPSSTKDLDQRHLIAKGVVDSLFSKEATIDGDEIEGALPKVGFVHEEQGTFILQTISEFDPSSAKFVHEFIHFEIGTVFDLEVESFCSLPFRFFELDNKKYLVTEAVICSKEAKEGPSHYLFVKGLSNQLRLGLRSSFYGRMVMEMKGSSLDGKTTYVQEHVMRYIHRFPERFDYDLLPMMNEFISLSSDSFIKDRSVRDLSSAVLSLYSYSKKIDRKAGASRRIFVRAKPFYVEELFGRKKVLQVVVALSYLSENERLGKKHLVKACRKFIRTATVLDETFMKISTENKKSCLVYFELEKKDGVIAYEDKKKVEDELVKHLEMHIQKYMRKIFMPQNTEEVIKYTVALSKELKSKKDYPQIAVLFDSQTAESLLFTAIIVKGVNRSLSAFDIFAKDGEKGCNIKIKHVRSLGEEKEGLEISYSLRISSFMREDYSVDIYRARAKVVQDLQKRFGVVRDYNGGMLEKQGGLLLECQSYLRKKGVKNTVLVENFFYAMNPSEMRSILDASSFASFFMHFYDMFTYTIAKDSVIETLSGEVIFLARVKMEKKKEAFLSTVKSLDAPIGDLIYFSLCIQEKFYIGASYKYFDEEAKQAFVDKMSICLKV